MSDIFFEGEIDGVYRRVPVELKGLSKEELYKRLCHSPDWNLKSLVPAGAVREGMWSEITLNLTTDFPEQEQE